MLSFSIIIQSKDYMKIFTRLLLIFRERKVISHLRIERENLKFFISKDIQTVKHQFEIISVPIPKVVVIFINRTSMGFKQTPGYNDMVGDSPPVEWVGSRLTINLRPEYININRFIFETPV